MGRLASLRRIHLADAGVLARAWVLLLFTPFLLRVLPLSRLLSLRRLRRGPALPPERVARLVEIAARSLPTARCLPVALVTARLLALQGTSATLHIGVARHADRLTAHAWLEWRGVTLLGAPEAGDYTPILAVAVAAPRVPGGGA